MKQISLVLKFTLVVFLLTAIHTLASDQKLPEIGGEKIVATVNNEPITLEEFTSALSQIHSPKVEEKKVGVIDYKGILDRLIDVKLIVMEARNIGLDELPEVKDAVDKYSKNAFSGLLRREHVKDIQVDEEEADKLYKEAVREFKLKSVLFDKKDEAKKIEEEIKANGNFDDIVKRISADKTAKGKEEGYYFKGQELAPKIIEALSVMKIGSVSPVIEVTYGFVIFKLEDIRFPENPGAKEKAREQALEYKRKNALEKYKDSLIEKYVKIDEKALDSLNYESSKEELEKLLEDNRIIAEIEGEQPITAGGLTEALVERYFHGVEVAIKGKKLNNKKRETLDNLLQKRVFIKEALKQGIDKSKAYKNLISEYENSVIFDKFINKVVASEIKLATEELKKYYNENINEYSSPEIIKIYSIVFEKRDDAEGALERLRKGADFKWLSANAEGQVNKKIQEGLLKFEGNLLPTSDMPEEVKKAVSGAKSGDFRLYASPEGYFYALYIEDVFPSKPATFEEVRELVAKKIFDDKLKKSIEGWVDKLKKVYKVKIYATDFKD